MPTCFPRPEAFAWRLAAQPPLAIQGARRAIDAAWFRDPDDSFAVAVEAQIRCLESDDFRKAGRAISEGRPPSGPGISSTPRN